MCGYGQRDHFVIRAQSEMNKSNAYLARLNPNITLETMVISCLIATQHLLKMDVAPPIVKD
jgi:hypothetical protein